MVDSKCHSAAASIESIKDAHKVNVGDNNKEKQLNCVEEFKERLKRKQNRYGCF